MSLDGKESKPAPAATGGSSAATGGNSIRGQDPEQVAAELCRLIGEVKPERREAARPQARLQSDIGLDSVAIIDLVLAAEDAFGVTIPDDETGDLMDATVAELAERLVALKRG